MKFFKYMFILLAACLIESCYYPFDLDIDDDPMIFLESYPGLDNVVAFRIEAAYSNSNTSVRPELDPHIVFEVNGKEIPVMLNTGCRVSEKYPEYYYLADYKPVPGDVMSVEVSSEGFDTIHADTVIPMPFPERKIDYREEKLGDRNLDILHIDFMDDGDDDNAYGVQILKETVIYYPDSTDVRVYRSSGNQLSDYYEMSPETLDGIDIYVGSYPAAAWMPDHSEGGRMNLSVVVDTYAYENLSAYDSFFVWEGEADIYDEDGNKTGKYRYMHRNKLVLYSMSDEFYRFRVAQELVRDNSDFVAGLAPSNFCYTNIIGGYGAFAGITAVETDWITPEFIEKNR